MRGRSNDGLDTGIATAGVAFVAVSAWSATVPDGGALPTAGMLVMAAAMTVLLLGHIWKHLGGKLMGAFVAVAFTVEWAFEQTNIMYGGFVWGDLRYGDYAIFSVHLGSVPVAVLLCMAVILWPTYAAVNLALDGRVVVDPRMTPWWQNVWRCVLYGFVHSWLMFMCNELCVRWWVYRWVGHSASRPAEDMSLGDPAAPAGGLVYVVVTMLVFTFVMVPWLGRGALRRDSTRPLEWVDGAPVLFWAVLALQNYFNEVNNATVANVVMWTMGFFAVLAGYRFVALMLAQRRNRDPLPDSTLASPTKAGAHTGPGEWHHGPGSGRVEIS